MIARLYSRGLGAAVFAALFVFALPPGRVANATATLLSATGAVLIVAGARKHRPRGITGWYLLATACFVSALSEMADALGAGGNFLEIADGIATGGSLLVGGAGIAVLCRYRGRAAWNGAALLDFLVIVTAGSLFVLDVLIPTDQRVGLAQVFSLLGCLAAVGVFTLVVRMLSGRASTYTSRMLGLAVVSAVISGALSALEIESRSTPAATQVMAVMLVALAAHHESMRKVTERADSTIHTFTLVRALLLSAALLVSVVDAAVLLHRASGVVDTTWLVGSVCIALVIGLRVRMLLGERDQARLDAEDRNSQLHGLARAGERLLTVTTPQDAIALVSWSVTDVFGSAVEVEFRSFDPLMESAEANDEPSETLLRITETLRTDRVDHGSMTFDFDTRVVNGQQARDFVRQLLNMTAMSIRRMEAEEELRRSQKLEAVGRLAAGLAHELNTPLQFVQSNVLFLREAFERAMGHISEQQLKEDDDLIFAKEEVATTAEQSIAGLKRAAQIVRGMRLVGESSMNDTRLVEPDELVRLAVTLAQAQLSNVATVDLSLRATQRIICNNVEITEALLAIIINATEALIRTHGSGSDAGDLRIHTFDEGGWVCVTIADNGGGIPPELHERVWEQFFTTKGPTEGSGLGLSVARSFVTQAGGSVDFSSDRTGTMFTVRLPASP